MPDGSVGRPVGAPAGRREGATNSSRGGFPRWIDRGGTLAAVLALALGAAACVPSRSVPTPIVVVVTFPPTPTPMPTLTPSPTPTPTPSPSPTLPPTPVVLGSPSPSYVSTTAPASACAGTAANKGFWSQASNALPWSVYCPVLPAGWVVKSGNYEGTPPGWVTMSFAGPNGATLKLDEGGFCTTGQPSCSPHVATIGPASFGGLAGTLYSTSSGFAVYVNPGTTLAYSLAGTGLSQAAFASIAAGLVRIVR
jgi:hypothetical protein